MFQPINEAGLTWLTVPAFTATGLVSHGFTTRGGGVSPAPYRSLNLGFTVADQPTNVVTNRRRATQALGLPLAKLVTAQQVHGDRIATVTEVHGGRGALVYKDALTETDALITKVPGLPISTYHADCVPIFLLDPVTPAIGLAHGGWQGTALKIAAKTVTAMVSAFGTRPENCLAAIGPAIGPCCYEVDRRVKDVFAEEFPAAHQFFAKTHGEHWQLDLWAANRLTLTDAGIPTEQIFISGACTACHSEQFFSHRKEGPTGRMAAFMMLQD